MSCPFPKSHKRSDSIPSSSVSINTVQDKKQYDKQATRNRIGHAFRNSWGRKDSEQKVSKKSSSQVMTFSFCFLSGIHRCLDALFVFAAGYGN
jgi:stromal membrane-associated protein